MRPLLLLFCLAAAACGVKAWPKPPRVDAPPAGDAGAPASAAAPAAERAPATSAADAGCP